MNKFCLFSILFLSNSLMAEEYYAPTKKELEPLARIPMPAYQLSDDSLIYTLPRDLTGRSIEVKLLRENKASTEMPRLYKGPLASVACMGSNLLPACVVTHKNLNIAPDEVKDYLKGKYKDPKKLSDAISIAANFNEGNEPIGFMSKRSLPVAALLPKIWTVQILRFGEGNTVNPEAVANLDMTSAELKVQGEWQGFKLESLSDEGMHISANYSYYQEQRWIDLTVSTDKAKIEGSWGVYDVSGNALPALGLIKGNGL